MNTDNKTMMATLERSITPTFGRVNKSLRERMATAAASLSRLGMAKAESILANDALAAAINLLYEQDARGRLTNVDPGTWMIRVPMPFGRDGAAQWGLKDWEGRILRSVLFARQEKAKPSAELRSKPATPPLFYFAENKRWQLNIGDYPTAAAANAYLTRYPITPESWLSHRDYHTAKRQSKGRPGAWRNRPGAEQG